jgi:hypothetical protein
MQRPSSKTHLRSSHSNTKNNNHPKYTQKQREKSKAQNPRIKKIRNRLHGSDARRKRVPKDQLARIPRMMTINK